MHRYRLALEKGQFLRLVVDQQGIDAEVALEAPDGSPLLIVDRLIDDRGPELILAVAEEAGDYTLAVRGFPESHPGRYQGSIEVLRPASATDRRLAEAYRRFTAAATLRGQEALGPRTETLAAFRELGEVALEAEALNSLAQAHFDLRDWPQAADLYRQAAGAFAHAGEPRWEAMARADLASNLIPLVEVEEAAREATKAAVLARQQGDHRTAAQALHCLGQARQNQGDLQEALDHYLEALELWPKEEPGRTFTLHNLGVLYARSFHDVLRGRELLLEARAAWRPGQEGEKAGTLSQLGRLAYERGALDEARKHLEEALALREKTDRCGSAVYRARLALVEERQNAPTAADERLAEALAIVAAEKCPKSEPRIRLLAASLEEGRGHSEAARASYRRCESLSLTQGDRLAAAECQAGIARAERSVGNLPAALAASGRALEIVEGVRPTVLREDLRTSFFAGARPAFDAHIDLLLEAGADEEAWSAAEQARARVLRDLLAEAGAGLRQSADPSLVERERRLQRRLNALESKRQQVGERSADKFRQEIDGLVAELESLRGELRRASPRYAALTQPSPPTLVTARRELLDTDTLLLEVRLSEPASTLWALSRESFVAVRLPPRSAIEALARESLSWQRSVEWPGHFPAPLCELSRLLLAPVASLLGHRRLVVVADGALEALSFAALPDPTTPAACADAPALVDAHEIVYLPSAAALLAQRHLLSARRPVPGWLAVLADPAYGTSGRWRRLPRSAEEAAAIAATLPPGRALVKTGSAASRQTVASGALAGYRILHFATHGLLNAERPLLSALALAELDEGGRPVEGALPAHEIFDLDLPAELVVLSACETAGGREVPGEGLVAGLPRAFLYAGAARVLVSLWAVEDQSTRDLMELFYRGLLQQRLPPDQALAAAQLSLRRAGRPPHQWAGFVLLGDWRPLPPF